MNRARWQLFCYDIADPGRLRRVHRRLRDEGIPLQYSVFLVHATPLDRIRIAEAIRELMDENRDDLRIYPVSSTVEFLALGRQELAPGMTLTEEGLIRLEKAAENGAQPTADPGNDS